LSITLLNLVFYILALIDETGLPSQNQFNGIHSFVLTSHYYILAVDLDKGLMTDEFINPNHEACTSKRKHMLCLTENTAFFLNL